MESRERERESQIQNLALIGQLAGGVAHDFNNLLTAMVFNLERLKATTNELPELHPPLRALELLMARASTTTRQLLTFARQRTLDTRPLEVNAVLRQSLELLGRLLGDSIEVLFLPDPGEHWIRADAAMVDQAVLNLCFNARDAMPRGGVLTVETRRYVATREALVRCPEAEPGEYVQLRFSDTGQGIAPEHLGRVFEPFFTTKETGKGTGLGLASVYGGARQHGGWAEVESTLGRGSEFSIFLPLIAAPAKVPESPAPSLKPIRGTLLVVEDDQEVRSSVVAMLKDQGFLVFEASTATEGWSVLNRQSDIDLVLTDWMMPGALKGMEWATKLKQQRPSLPVVLMSGYAAEAVGDGPAGPQDIVLLSKPFLMETLMTVIETCLTKGGEATTPS